MRYEKIMEGSALRLSDLADIQVGNEDADFWLVRRGSENEVGKPVKEYNPQAIGIKVTETDKLDPQYLYYMMMHIHQQGKWKSVATGTLRLVNIRTQDVKNIRLG